MTLKLLLLPLLIGLSGCTNYRRCSIKVTQLEMGGYYAQVRWCKDPYKDGKNTSYDDSIKEVL